MDKIKGVYKITNNKNNLVYIGYRKAATPKNVVLWSAVYGKRVNKKIRELRKNNKDIIFSIETIKETDTNEAEQFMKQYDSVNNGLNVFYNIQEAKDFFKRVYAGKKKEL